MTTIRDVLSGVPWSLAIVLALTLGLAPFRPPHLFEKLQMLAQGTLRRPVDWFDLLLHGLPWLLLLAKGAASLSARR